MSQMDIGSCIREIRTIEGLNSIDLSNAVGIDATTLTKIETGKIKNPAYDTIFKIVEMLSKTSTILDNKIDLTKYQESVVKIFKAFKDMPNIEERYRNEVINEKLCYLSENINYISSEELEMINIFSLGKKTLIDTQKAIEQFKDNARHLISDKIIESFNDFDFSKAILLLIERDIKVQESINSILKSIITNGNRNDIANFLPTLLNYLSSKGTVALYKSSLDGTLDREKEFEEYLNNSDKKKQYNQLGL